MDYFHNNITITFLFIIIKLKHQQLKLTLCKRIAVG